MSHADQTDLAASRPATPVAIDASPETDGLDTDLNAERVSAIGLRPIEPGDREWFLASLARSRESIARWLPLNRAGETDEAFFERQLRLCAEGDRDHRSLRRLGVLADGTPAGLFALNSISRGLSWEADAIWWVDAECRGRGIATAGVRALLAHAFADLPGGLGLHGVHCGIEAGNDASVRVAARCGFAHDATKRSHLEVNGRWAVHEFYLATPDSFEAAVRESDGTTGTA